jgi:hypothetical protein
MFVYVHDRDCVQSTTKRSFGDKMDEVICDISDTHFYLPTQRGGIYTINQ